MRNFDDFYELEKPTLSKVREILAWADQNGIKTEVTMREEYVNIARVKSDNDFESVFKLIDEMSVDFFRIILRKQMELFPKLADTGITKNMLEIAIRGIDVGAKEYFIFIWLEESYLDALKRKFALKLI